MTPRATRYRLDSHALPFRYCRQRVQSLPCFGSDVPQQAQILAWSRTRWVVVAAPRARMGTLPTQRPMMGGGSERLAVVSELGAVGLSPGCRVAEQPLKQSPGPADFSAATGVYFDHSSRPLLSFSFFDRSVESPKTSGRLPFRLEPSRATRCRSLRALPSAPFAEGKTAAFLRAPRCRTDRRRPVYRGSGRACVSRGRR
jgi:hypothetical protein